MLKDAKDWMLLICKGSKFQSFTKFNIEKIAVYVIFIFFSKLLIEICEICGKIFK